MIELLVTRGLPASGKTTIARAWVDDDPAGRVRVNRDDLRHNLYGRYHGLTREQEDTVTVAQRAAVAALLGRTGDPLDRRRSVVVDDTHLRLAHVRAWEKLAAELGVLFTVRDVPTTVSTCIFRDDVRGRAGERAVGSDVIQRLAARYGLTDKRFLAPFVPAPELSEVARRYDPDDFPGATRPTWLVDMDGTLALMDGRGPFEWHRVGEDALNVPVAALVRAIAGYSRVVVVSGRDEVCRRETELWLEAQPITYDELVMRPEGDTRKDAIVKEELFWERIAPRYRVVGVLDDRDQVVRMWRSIGLTCLQVAPGGF